MRKRQTGFTLIELLIVVVILGLLATIGLGAYFKGQVRARDARRKTELKSVATALEAYYNDNNKYPDSSAGALSLDGCTNGVCAWGTAMRDAAGTSYMAIIPKDPRTGWSYCYVTQNSSQAYILFARIEDNQDSVIPQISGQNAFYPTADLGCNQVAGQNYNYAVYSSNAVLPDIQPE